MRLRKAIKRIVALGTGATMVGATILGAMAAADLANFPAPFVEDGAFNALIVVGAAAKTDDVLGSIDIATSLQYSTTVTKPVPGTGTTVSVTGEGYKVETDSNKLILGEPLYNVTTNVDDDDLPLLLADGVYVNDGDDESVEYKYTQKLAFGKGDNASVTWLRDRDYVDEDNPYLMLYSAKATGSGAARTRLLSYTLDFSKDAETDCYSSGATTCGSAYEMCDFEDTKVELLGVEYEVTKAEYQAGKVTWEMMGGVSLNTMYEGETKTFTVNGVDYEVTVDIISDTGSASETVIITVNGESTKELSKDQTDKVAGIELGIKQVMGNEAGEAGAGKDLVQFYLGAQKVTLTDDSATTAMDTNVKIGGTEVDELYVDWTVSTATNVVKLDKLELVWAPDDDVFVSEDESVSFPGLDSFKLEFAGMTSDGEEELVVIEPDGDQRIQIEAPLEAGKTTFEVLFSNGTALADDFTSFGDSATAGEGVLNVATGAITEGDYILLTDEDERETHIVQLDDVSTKNVTRLKDLADGTKYEATCTNQCTINVGDLSAIFSSVSQGSSPPTATLAAGSHVGHKIYTKEGLTINISSAVSGAQTHLIQITEEDKNGRLEAGDSFLVTAGKTSSYKTSVEAITDVNAFEYAPGASTTDSYQYGSSKVWGYYTKFGTKLEWDKSGDENLLKIYYPGEESHANVFVNSEAATVIEGGGESTYEEVQRIDVGAAVLDIEAGDLTSGNMIVVGGPCVNTLAAELMGNPAECAEGFEMGKAMIKLFEHDNGNVALLVAGYGAMDTRRACRAVANYDQEPVASEFMGMELEVTGTSLTDYQVGAPSPEPEVEEPEAEEPAEGEE